MTSQSVSVSDMTSGLFFVLWTLLTLVWLLSRNFLWDVYRRPCHIATGRCFSTPHGDNLSKWASGIAQWRKRRAEKKRDRPLRFLWGTAPRVLCYPNCGAECGQNHKSQAGSLSLPRVSSLRAIRVRGSVQALPPFLLILVLIIIIPKCLWILYQQGVILVDRIRHTGAQTRWRRSDAGGRIQTIDHVQPTDCVAVLLFP